MNQPAALMVAVEQFIRRHAGEWVRLRGRGFDIRVYRGDATWFAERLAEDGRLPFSVSAG